MRAGHDGQSGEHDALAPRACTYADNTPDVLSALTIGQPSSDVPNASFRFDLHLPTPFDQTYLLDKATKALPISALFPPEVSTPDRATKFSSFVGGPVGTDMKNASFKFKNDPQENRLVTFGLAPKDPDNDLLFYDGNRHGGVFISSDCFWASLQPGWTTGGCLRLPTQMGFNVVRNAFLVLVATNAADMSARLPQPKARHDGVGNMRTSRFRVALTAAKSDGQAGKIVWQDKKFALDLQDEIGSLRGQVAARLRSELDDR